MSFVAWWGAGLSTLLALIKIGEVWRDRFQIDVGCSLSNDPDVGNDIFIRNLSSRPAILSYWIVQYRSGIWPFYSYSEVASPEGEAQDIRIDSHASKTLSFSQQDYFAWGQKVQNGRRICIRLFFVGRRPLVRRIDC